MSRRRIIGISQCLHCDSCLIQVSLSGFIFRVLEQRKKESGGGKVDMSDVLDGFQKKARDHARIPMQVSMDL